MSGRAQKDSGKNFRLRDIVVIVLCLSAGAFFFNIFWLDLNQETVLYNEEPAGSITYKNNKVQRRVFNRVLWDRLSVESPVYLGDLIRVGEFSDASMSFFDGTRLDLNDYTIIRIQRYLDEEGRIQIDRIQGSPNLNAGAGGKGIILHDPRTGETIRVSPGSIVTGNGEVIEGSVAVINESGQSRTVNAGENIGRTEGPAVVVIQPVPNARFLKSAAPIGFVWNRINLPPGQNLHLEISGEQDFSRIARRIEGENSAAADIGAGQWYWRLSYEDTVLRTGQLRVADASGAVLSSPVHGSLYPFQNSLPEVRFRWSEAEEALHYILEVGETPDLINPHISGQTESTFYSTSNLEEGTWYWRVTTIFPPVYEGVSPVSAVASFRIVQGNEPEVRVQPDPAPPSQTPQDQALSNQAQPPDQRPPQVSETPPPARNQPEPVPPPPLLTEPGNRFPPSGEHIGIEELKAQRRIDFRWSAVPGANAYIVTIYQQTAADKRLIYRTNPMSNTYWTLNNLNMLDLGTFIWEVEAVSRNRSSGEIERRGSPGENIIEVNVPPSGPVQVEETGILYGRN